jgi:acyl carrier protein
MRLSQALVEFIEKNLVGSENPTPITDSTPLIDQGIINSMGLMQVIGFVEDRTGVRVSDDEVTPDNFQTVVSIEAMVTRLERQRAGGC